MNEVWKDIQGYENLYQVSNLGRIKNLKPRFKNKDILKSSTSAYGYKIICLYKNKIRKQWRIHRLVATAFILNCDNKPLVNHIDGNKTNNKVDNLEWVTSSENNFHATHNGLSAGHRQNTSKLTKEDVLFIRKHYKKYDKNFNSYKLAEKFNIHNGNILKIVYGKSYKLDGGKIQIKERG